jgi:hypothetical protein
MRNFLGQDGFIWWVGVVEDDKDPVKLGRCRVRIFGYHPPLKENLVPTGHLPWSTSIISTNTRGIYKAPKKGDWVIGFFLDGETMQEPAVFGMFPSEPIESKEYFSLPPFKFQKGDKKDKIEKDFEQVTDGTLANKAGIEDFKSEYAFALESNNVGDNSHGHFMMMYDEPEKEIFIFKSSLGHEIVLNDNTFNSFVSLTSNDGRVIEINDTKELIKIESLNHSITINDKLNTISLEHSTGALFTIDALGNITVNAAPNRDLNFIGKNVNVTSTNFNVNATNSIINNTKDYTVNASNNISLSANTAYVTSVDLDVDTSNTVTHNTKDLIVDASNNISIFSNTIYVTPNSITFTSRDFEVTANNLMLIEYPPYDLLLEDGDNVLIDDENDDGDKFRNEDWTIIPIIYSPSILSSIFDASNSSIVGFQTGLSGANAEIATIKTRIDSPVVATANTPTGTDTFIQSL